MQIVFAGSVPKEPDHPEWNEDVFLNDEQAGRLALSDGASESFDSKRWARLLTERFLADPAVTTAWVALAAEAYRAEADYGTLSWAKQLAFERGSAATLLGVEFNRDQGCLEILAVGDSLALLTNGAVPRRSWRYDNWQQFDTRPTLLSTVPAHNAFVEEPDFDDVHRVSLPLAGLDDPVLLCMTDALGRWALRSAEEGGDAIARLLTIDSEAALHALVEGERAQARMRVDDTTLIVVRFGPEDERRDELSLA